MIEERKRYRITEDMSPDGWLQIMMEDDGDVIVSVFGDGFGCERQMASVQFCTRAGGGKHNAVRKALVAVAEAIDAETGTTEAQP